MQISTTVLDVEKFNAALAAAGYKSISVVAKKIGVHRNTINHFLSGSSVFPESINKLVALLRVDPRDLITTYQEGYGYEIISTLVDKLIDQNHNCCFALFGSRARNTHKRFSDFDIGVFSKEGLSHGDYLKLIETSERESEDLPVKVDIVNLNRADTPFLEVISNDLIFLGGKFSDWISLKERVRG